jgi:hypothetical protein
MTDSNQTTESNEVDFHQKVETPLGRTRATRVAIGAGAAFLFVAGAVAAMGASPAPSIGTDPTASTAPGSSAAPDASTGPGATKQDGHRHGPRGLGRGGFGRLGVGLGFRDITITAIDGFDVSLATADGWTRTISVTSSTPITKGGTTVTVADLAVGDRIVFGQDRAADGTYTVTAIRVVLPVTGGEVTAIDGNTITVIQPGGTSATIHVDGETTYRVNGAAGALSDVKVGSFIVAEGTQRADGSLDAAQVRVGLRGHGGFKGPGVRGDHRGQEPNAGSPAPSGGTS